MTRQWTTDGGLEADADASKIDKTVLEHHINALSMRAKGYGVISGCKVTPQSPNSDKVDIGAGTAFAEGTIITLDGTDEVTFPAVTVNPRYDLVVISSGAVTRVAGTEAVSPEPPKLPEDSILLAIVYIDETTTVTVVDSDVFDFRVFISKITDERINSTLSESKIAFNATAGHNHDGMGSKKIDHVNLLNKGTNTHAQIDTHIATTVGNPHNVKASELTDFDTEVSSNTDVYANTAHRGNTSNPHNVQATQITDFDTEVSNNTDVYANTAHRGNTANPHNTKISTLGDTTISTPVNNQILAFDGSSSRWINKNHSDAGLQSVLSNAEKYYLIDSLHIYADDTPSPIDNSWTSLVEIDYQTPAHNAEPTSSVYVEAVIHYYVAGLTPDGEVRIKKNGVVQSSKTSGLTNTNSSVMSLGRVGFAGSLSDGDNISVEVQHGNVNGSIYVKKITLNIYAKLT